MTVSRLIRICRQRLTSLFRKDRLDDQLDQELLFHLAQLEQENIEAGMTAEEARTAARRELGNMAVLTEECRDQRGVSWYHDFLQDFRYGLRLMRKHPGFTAIAAVSLAVAIGGNAAILSFGNSLWLGDMPLPDAERLVLLRLAPNRTGFGLVAVPDYASWKQATHTFQSMGASFANSQDLSADQTGGYPENLAGQLVTASLFGTLNVQPLLGRVFGEDEEQGELPVVVLSYRLWQRRFGGDPGILGRQIRMSGQNRKIIGIMPDGFWYPSENTEYWIPLAFSPAQLKGSDRLYTVTARLKDGTTVEQAQAELRSITAERAIDFPNQYEGLSLWVVPLREAWYGWLRPPLLTMQAAVILVLLIACANVSTLLLGHVPARRPEIAMRLLMGAGRGRIVRQFFTESLLLSIVGGALGLVVAWLGVQSLQGLTPPLGRTSLEGMGQSSALIAYAALFSAIATLLFGFLPALAAFSSTNDVHQASVHGRRRDWSGILVPIQIGLALILSVASGLLFNSFVRLVLDDRGFDPKGVLTFTYRIPIQDYVRPLGSHHGLPAMDAVPPTLAIQRVYNKLRALPGAESVAGASFPPVNSALQQRATLHVNGRAIPSSPAARDDATVVYFLVTENFFSTLKTPLLRGRDFAAQDTAAGPWVAVVNETLARQFWPGEDPIGKHFTVDAISGEQQREVVGIVRDVGLNYIRNGPAPPVAYTLYLQQPLRYQGVNTGRFGQMTFFVRSSGDPLSLVSAARQAVAEEDPNRALTNIQTMEGFVGEGMRARRYYASAIGVFAFLATALAAIGVYGVMSFSVSRRTREIGVRIAMGAQPYDIVVMVGGRALRMVALGLLFGLLGSLALTRWMATQLWGVSPTDPATYIGVTSLLAAVSLAACFRPARRAMRVNPTEALRWD